MCGPITGPVPGLPGESQLCRCTPVNRYLLLGREVVLSNVKVIGIQRRSDVLLGRCFSEVGMSAPSSRGEGQKSSLVA